MLATGVNAAMLAALLRSRGATEPVLMSNGPCRALGEPWSSPRAAAALSAGRTTIVAGGWGRPYVSTDYPAVGFAAEIHAQAVLMAKSGTDGVYDSDPAISGDARFLPELSIDEALSRGLTVMDEAALLLARDRNIVLHVFAADDPDLPVKIVKGEQVGSLIFP
jgi:uridylate kinase